jgi:hypothetical protein
MLGFWSTWPWSRWAATVRASSDSRCRLVLEAGDRDGRAGRPDPSGPAPDQASVRSVLRIAHRDRDDRLLLRRPGKRDSANHLCLTISPGKAVIVAPVVPASPPARGKSSSRWLWRGWWRCIAQRSQSASTVWSASQADRVGDERRHNQDLPGGAADEAAGTNRRRRRERRSRRHAVGSRVGRGGISATARGLASRSQPAYSQSRCPTVRPNRHPQPPTRGSDHLLSLEATAPGS